MGLLPVLSAKAAYTWPSSTDHLEDILYLQQGWLHFGFRDGKSIKKTFHEPAIETYLLTLASGVTPCTFSSAGGGRQTAAEWVRTAYHDMATYDIDTGLGGIDASIAFELGRAENPGDAFNGTFGFTSGFHSIKSSQADLIALGVVVASMSCGGPIVPFRAGRVDAIQAGVSGVPEPQQDLATHTAIFAKQGFNTSEMITMVACGHVLGGVHGVDFPQITGDDTNFPKFNTRFSQFGNTIVTEYLEDNSTDVLVMGKNDTFNSDKRIFAADGNKTMTALADPTNFQAQCRDIFARMIDTVPATVKLSEVITPIEVKPYKLSLSLAGNNTLSFSGHIRIRTTERDASKTTVSLQYRDRKNDASSSPIITTQETYMLGQSYGFDKEIFQWYTFSTTLDASSSISSFDVVIHTDGAADEINNNNGSGFPMSDAILFQSAQSCQPQTAVNEAGQWNLTISAAVRAEYANSSVGFDWVYKRAIQGVAINALEVQRTPMEKVGEEVDGYYMFTGTKPVDIAQWETTFDVVLGEGDGAKNVEFLDTSSLSTSCEALPS